MEKHKKLVRVVCLVLAALMVMTIGVPLIFAYAETPAEKLERLRKELEDIKARVAASKVTSLFDNAETVGDVKIASAYFTGTSGDTLRGMCDTIRDNAKAAAVAVATPCCPAPVSAIILVFPIFLASSTCPKTLLIL